MSPAFAFYRHSPVIWDLDDGRRSTQSLKAPWIEALELASFHPIHHRRQVALLLVYEEAMTRVDCQAYCAPVSFLLLTLVVAMLADGLPTTTSGVAASGFAQLLAFGLDGANASLARRSTGGEAFSVAQMVKVINESE